MIERIRVLDPLAVVVASSGVAEGDLVTRARNAGARQLIAKPYTPDALLRTIADAIGARN